MNNTEFMERMNDVLSTAGKDKESKRNALQRLAAMANFEITKLHTGHPQSTYDFSALPGIDDICVKTIIPYLRNDVRSLVNMFACTTKRFLTTATIYKSYYCIVLANITRSLSKLSTNSAGPLPPVTQRPATTWLGDGMTLKEYVNRPGGILMTAAETKHQQILHYLVDIAYADETELVRNYKKEFPLGTPIVCACEYGRLEDVKLLVAGYNGAKTTVSRSGYDSFGKIGKPLQIAVKNKHFTLAKYIVELMYPNASNLEKKYYVECPRGTPLVCACQLGRLDDVKLLIADANITQYENQLGTSVCGKYECTPLMAAALKQHFPILQYLIEQCEADPNTTGVAGFTPLHIAAKNKKTTTELIELLLAHMSVDSINKKDKWGRTPLDLAYYNTSPIQQILFKTIKKAGGTRG